MGADRLQPCEKLQLGDHVQTLSVHGHNDGTFTINGTTATASEVGQSPESERADK